MQLFIAQMYVYIYNQLYTQDSIIKNLTLFSKAISDSLKPNSILGTAFITIRSIAMGILLVYFVISMGTKLQSKETSPSVVFRVLLSYMVGYLMALNSFDFVKYMFEYGDYLAFTLTETVNTNPSLDDYVRTIKFSIDNLDFFATILYLLKAILPYIACIFVNFVILYAMVSRVLRLCVAATLSPIAISNMFDGRKHSNGVRFMKRTMSMALQCSVIVLISITITNITSYLNADPSYISDKMVTKVAKTRDAMLESETTDFERIGYLANLEIAALCNKAVDSKGYIHPKYDEARNKLSQEADIVTSDKEEKYMQYEKLLHLFVFQRTENREHYIYNEDGYAKCIPEFSRFDGPKTIKFFNTLLGGKNYFLFLMLLVIKIGLIKKATSLCNNIVGV